MPFCTSGYEGRDLSIGFVNFRLAVISFTPKLKNRCYFNSNYAVHPK